MEKKPLKLRISPRAETLIRRGHPWLFESSIREASRPGSAGEMAVIYDGNNRFLAIGFYDPLSPIRLRVIHAGKPRSIDAVFWREKLAAARDKRTALAADGRTTGIRWINGESDGFPALILDQYHDSLVAKIYSAAWFSHLPALLGLVRELWNPASIILRLSRNIQSQAAREGFPADGTAWHGTPPVPVIFLENGIRFQADVFKGQKTGFFLDQRENRQRIGELASGRRVLNAFSYSGGFSLHAARGGAAAVCDIDISGHALEQARANWALNLHLPAVAACAREEVQADAFRWLGEAPAARRFDLVIVDPPSLAKRETERPAALSAYGRLAAAGLKRVSPGGVLMASSCSAHVSADEFYQAVLGAARASGRSFTELGRHGHASDHPASFAEAEYLKTVFLRMSG